jgi:L-serine dehydratase
VLRRDDSPRVAVIARRSTPLSPASRGVLAGTTAAVRVFESAPVYFVQTGPALFTSAAEMVARAGDRRVSLGTLALEYEATLLGLTPDAVVAEMLRRYDVMEASARQGLEPAFGGMQLLSPTAGSIFRAEAARTLSLGGPHTRAAARAMAVMHVDAAMGVVCAAPTGGSAGTIPGAMVTLAEERGLDRRQIALSMLAAGAIGVIVAQRATFAAEVAGCQVEIGASGAMAAAAVVDAVGGSADQACHAAAIGFQNTMGLVCDPVQGMVEIPCHTRNAAAAASAFVVADLVLGGYANPIPLDETIDAVYAVGRAMSTDLLCTAQGGLAVTPSALAMRGACCGKGCAGC